MSEGINLNIFKGKYLKLANKVDKANINDGVLSGSEISIFLQECENKGYKYQKKSWFNSLLSAIATATSLAKQNSNLEKVSPDIPSEEWIPKIKPLDLNFNSKEIEHYNIYNETTIHNTSTKITKGYKNNKSQDGNGNADVTIQTHTDNNGTITVTYNSEQIYNKQTLTQTTTFQYNINDLENYVINEASRNGHPITYFKEINEIRSLPEDQRTEKQKALLEEFNNLIKFATETGTEYGVDPKQILAIIQQEVNFQGLGNNVTGINGKGYMQLTTIAIADMLGCTKYTGSINTALFEADNKIDKYGVEIIELFNSRGFNILSANTEQEKRELLKDIMKYLTENKDAEFNIRVGTIKLRQLLNKTNGDFGRAAFLYNGNPACQDNYKKGTTLYYAQLSADFMQTEHTYNKNRLA